MGKQWWIFTFGVGSYHQKKYVRIYGTCDDARNKMFELFGKHWCSQYTENQFKNTSMIETYECLDTINDEEDDA